jgi:hypothetical protein
MTEEVVHQFACSICGVRAHCNGEEYDYREAWGFAKQAGWRCKEINGEWHRWCPSCVKNWANTLADKRAEAKMRRAKHAAADRLIAMVAPSAARH